MKRALLITPLLCLPLVAGTESRKIFITDRDAWEQSAALVAHENTAVASMHSGIRRQNTEQIKTMNKACPELTITSVPDSADFVVVWDTKTWGQTAWSGHQNEYTVYNKAGDLIGSGAAHKQTNAAKDICKIITKKD
jgi:hypothetical protein